ncbi:TPA: hypothetical protein ACGR6E_001203 [Enterobacter roggenkampii]|uniref:hypothetical protein n=1 Tax=Enterobacter roggenkampii TaxID=1812935 RepID=UPI0003BF82D8|nr:hypothetical protein [Enterobacter roggenkampii]EIP1107198.1 hypothetical protein [Citrobacter freundii]ESL74438.1 hypothetical protein L423_03850 [Enterobacter roggenkampii]MDU7186362.1 hypothetical protein [Klebsiella sp.]
MSKLFKLKEWLTVKEAAERLSVSLGEKVSVADCLQLALDEHITISALFNENQHAIHAKVVKTTQRKRFSKFITRTTDDGAYVGFIDEERFVSNNELDCEYEDIERYGGVFQLRHGIYDLPMLGAEGLDVMHKLDLNVGREPRKFCSMEGPFLITPYGMVNVLNQFNPWMLKANEKGSPEYYDKVKNEFVDLSHEGYHGFLYPADALEDFELVFRRENIEKFERENSDDTQQPLKLDEGLQVIGALLNALKKAEPASKRWTQEALKAEMMDHGVNLSPRLLDEYFSAANKLFKSVR